MIARPRRHLARHAAACLRKHSNMTTQLPYSRMPIIALFFTYCIGSWRTSEEVPLKNIIIIITGKTKHNNNPRKLDLSERRVRSRLAGSVRVVYLLVRALNNRSPSPKWEAPGGPVSTENCRVEKIQNKVPCSSSLGVLIARIKRHQHHSHQSGGSPLHQRHQHHSHQRHVIRLKPM